MSWHFRKTNDFSKEIEAHLLLEADRLKEQGLSEEEAIMAARRLFGNPTRVQEQFCESRPWFMLGPVMQDEADSRSRTHLVSAPTEDLRPKSAPL
jgi:hypothetical protein